MVVSIPFETRDVIYEIHFLPVQKVSREYGWASNRLTGVLAAILSLSSWIGTSYSSYSGFVDVLGVVVGLLAYTFIERVAFAC